MIGNGQQMTIKIGSGGGGGVIMNGGKINHAQNAIYYGINMRMKYKFMKIKEFHYFQYK